MQISSTALWSTNILQTKIPFSEEFLNHLSQFIISLSKDDKNKVHASNVGGWHSNYDLAQNQNEYNLHAHNKVNEIITWLYSQNDTKYFETHKLVMNSWANINFEGTFQSYHNHAEWALSAVLYVRVPENVANERNGSISFQDFSCRSMNPNFAELKHVLGEKERRIKVQASDLIIFPSHLPHAVNPTYVKEPRITIAFNFRTIPLM